MERDKREKNSSRIIQNTIIKRKTEEEQQFMTIHKTCKKKKTITTHANTTINPK